MSEWATRPRATPFAGHRKATLRWCHACETFHRTHRHPEGEETCVALELARTNRRVALGAGPAIHSATRMKRGLKG